MNYELNTYLSGMEKQITIRNIKIQEYKIDLSENSKGQPVARYSKLITVGKNKGQYKLYEGFYFTSEEKRQIWIREKISKIQANLAYETGRKEAKKAARENMKHDFKVGDIYYDSWGYDQTNIDFYEIIEVKAKSLVIQEIAGKAVKGTEGFDSVNVVPVAGDFAGKPEVKMITFYIQADGTPKYFIKSRHGWISKYEKEDRGVNCSWGR